MGRMLDTLKTRDGGITFVAPEPPPVAPREVVNEWAMRADDVPFIEIGPARSVEGSPNVLGAVRPQPAQVPPIQPPHPPTELAFAQQQAPTYPSPALSASILAPQPISANFEPIHGLYELGKVAAEIIAYHQPNHPISRQYSTLVDQLLQTDAGKVLLFSGLRSGVGTSTVLLNLAVAAAQRAQKSVVVVDAQQQRPSVASKLGVKPFAFLHDVLRGTVALEQAIAKSPLPKLAMVAATATGHPEIALGIEATTWLFSHLKKKFDMVLVDGPSLDASADIAPLAPLADAMYVVSPQGESAAAARPLLQVVQRIGGRLRGLFHTHPGT